MSELDSKIPISEGSEIPMNVAKLKCSKCDKKEPHNIYEHMGRLLYE